MPNVPDKQKRYCYVDETGQDTEGEFFFVAVAIFGEDRDRLRRDLAIIEESSGRNAKKWTRSTRKQRETYMRSVLGHSEFAGTLYYSAYRGARAYTDLTILSAAKAINTHTAKPHTATILVDGLDRSAERRFAGTLRKLRISVRKVRGLKDENDVFIRLADSLAGFVRDSVSRDEYLLELYNRALRSRAIREV
jgi:hypothetical protein